MRRPRRNHTAGFKAKVALAALMGDRTLAELAEKYDVCTGSQITQWKTQLLEGATGVFMSPAEKRGTEQGPSAKEMQAKIGQLDWKLIFWKSRSVASAMRAQSDDHQVPSITGETTGGVAGDLASERALPAGANVREGSGADARYRRAAPGIPFLGARQLRKILRREGRPHAGRLHVGTLMVEMGITALYRKPNTSQRHPGHKVYPYLLRHLAIERADHVWAMDIT